MLALLRKTAQSLLVFGLAACATQFQPMGMSIQEPRFSPDMTAMIMPDGFSLPLRVWEPSKKSPSAVVLAIHGFNDYSKAFEKAGAFWAQEGVVTYAYDQRGFGQASDPGIWAGQDTLVSDVRSAALAVRRQHPRLPLYILGESMGGAILIKALTDGTGFASSRPAGIILSAPAIWGRETMPVLHRAALWLTYQTIPGVTFRPPDSLKVQATDNIPLLRELSQDPLFLKGSRVDTLHGLVGLMDEALASADKLNGSPPLMILFGHKEQVLTAESVDTFLSRLVMSQPQAPRVATYPEGWHWLLRDLQADVVLKDIRAWMRSPHQLLPSGADKISWAKTSTAH